MRSMHVAMGIGLFLMFGAAVGCEDSSEDAAAGDRGTGTGGSGGSGGSSGSARDSGTSGTGGGSADAGGFSSTITISDSSNGGLFTGAPTLLEGVQVCVLGTSDCWTTDAKGEATLGVTLEDGQAFSLEKDGYQRAIDPIHLAAAQYVTDVSFDLVPDAVVEAFATVFGIEYPSDAHGIVGIHTFKRSADGTSLAGSLEGIDYELTTGTGDGPIYLSADFSELDTGATGTAPNGRAWFVNVEPGDIEITASGGTNCEAFGAWPSSDGNTLGGPVEINASTIVSIICD